MTLETFKEWKKRKAEAKLKKLEEKVKEDHKKTGGKGSNILSGRALFSFDPNMFQDDDDAADDSTY